MDNLLLLYIFTLLVAAYFGMSIVLRILSNIPSVGGYSYPHAPVAAPRNHDAGGNGSSGFSTTLLFLIVLAVLFWMLFSRSQGAEDTIEEAPTSEIEYSTVQQKEKTDVPIDTYRVSYQAHSAKRVNQSPTYDENVNHFGIQVVAVSSLPRAERATEEIGSHEPEIIQEDGMYKVVITGFKSLTEAKKYQKYYGIKGFARAV